MSKRGADEYITKEHGSTPNREAESKVKMATAAQLAKRKIAAPKSRLNRGNVGSPSPSPNPFSGSTFAPSQPSQQTFGSVGGGLTFGQTQLFPPSGSTGSDFTFSVPGQSTSFTFGQTVPNNPFANLNGDTVQDENKPPEDTLMESPNKKPAFGSGAFNSGQSTAVNGGLFSGFTGFAQSQQPPTSQSSIGSAQPQVNGFGNGAAPLFGNLQAASSSTKPSTQSPGPFGQISNAQPASSASTPTNGLFGQPTQPEKPVTTFGQPSSETPQKSFIFGQPSTQPPVNQSAEAPTFAFGQPSQTQPKGDTPKFSFGQTAGQQPLPTTSTPAAAVPQSSSSSTPSIFSQAQNTPAKNMFTGFVSPKPEVTPAQSAIEQSTAPANTPGSSNENASTSTSATPVSNPFASLFAQSSTGASPAPNAETPKPIFNFAAPAEPKALFSTAGTSTGQPTARAGGEPSTPALFGFKPVEPATSSNLFSPKAESEIQPAISTSGNNGLDKSSVAGKSDETPAKSSAFSVGQSSTSKTPLTTEPKTASGFFLGTPGSVATASTPATSLKRPAQALEPLQDKPTPTPKLASSATDAQGQSKPTATPTTANTTATSLGNTTATAGDPQRPVYTNPPARIPPYLSAEKYKSYDSNYRLHSLNREFQKRIACLDPTREDFENIVRTYVAARESIGESIGLYTRNIAGMKRKEDKMDEDDEDTATSTAKKVKQGIPSTTQSTPTQSQFGGSIFQPVPASQNSSSPVPNSKFTAATPGSSSTSSLFKSMIPEKATGTPSTSTNASNPFANLNAQTPNKTATGFKVGTSGGQPSSATKSATAKTTTPPSSPPKKSGFQPSGFAAPSATDFMSAFQKQSEANSAKFAKEAMEKRKAEEFDSDEDDEAEWTKKYEEEQRAKRAKLASFRGFTPSFENSDASDDNTSSKRVDKTSKSPVNISSDEGSPEDDSNEVEEGSGEDANEENEDDGDDEDEDSTNDQPLITNGKSIFDRISRGPDAKQDNTPKPEVGSAAANIFAQNHKASPETPSFSPITPSSTTPYKPATTFSFTPTPRDSPTPAAGASVFDGGITRGGPIPGEGLFGSRSGTPVDGETTTSNTLGDLGTSENTPGKDHTWKRGSGIKFGHDIQAPSVNITAASPVKETPKFGTSFGAGNTAAGGTSSSNTLGFSFASSTSAPAPGFLSAASHLAPGSGTTSGISSRATSPGATDNESVATNETDDAQYDPQTTLLAHGGPYPGEEDEDILFEARAKMFRHYKAEEIKGTKKSNGWNVEGLGPMRILKHKTTGKTRIVARAEPNANIVLNANLTPGVSYKASNSNVVIPVFGSGAPVQWMVKVKTSTIAAELASILEANKAP